MLSGADEQAAPGSRPWLATSGMNGWCGPCPALLIRLGAQERLHLHAPLLIEGSNMHKNGKPVLDCISGGHFVPWVILTQFPPTPAMVCVCWGGGGKWISSWTGVMALSPFDLELLELCLGSRIMPQAAGHGCSQALQDVLPVICPVQR